MKKSGLQNRFPDHVKLAWQLDWGACNVCGMNQWNALHHINAPSCRWYVSGEHNRSILNSCPIHNYTHPSAAYHAREGVGGFGITKPCHVGNEAWLYDKENASMLMVKTLKAVLYMKYELREVDFEFIRRYAFMYELQRERLPDAFRKVFERETTVAK